MSLTPLKEPGSPGGPVAPGGPGCPPPIPRSFMILKT